MPCNRLDLRCISLDSGIWLLLEISEKRMFKRYIQGEKMKKMKRGTIQSWRRVIAIMICMLLTLPSVGVTRWMVFAENSEPADAEVAPPEEAPTPEPTAVPTPEPTAVPTAVPTPEPTATPTPEPTATSTPEPTATPTLEPTAVSTATPTVEPTPEPTPDPMLEQLFGEGAMHLADFLILYPDAKLDGARYNQSTVPSQTPAAGNVNPDIFGFTVAGIDGAGAATYADISAVKVAFDVTIPDGVRSGDTWKGPVAGVREAEYVKNFPTILRPAAEGDAFSVEYRMEGLSINNWPIDGVGDVILDAESREFIYIYFKELPWNGSADGYVVLPVVRELRIQAAYAVERVVMVTPEPTAIPTPTPTPEPTEEPTPEPTEVPTPEPTEEPTPEPTEVPTPEPTEEPTPEPTEEPTPEPTEEPTPQPTEEPTPEPTEEPTPEPTEEPTPEPTEEPTPEPTEEPTPEPTEEPTPEPTEEPTPEPTEEPTPEPTAELVPDPALEQMFGAGAMYLEDFLALRPDAKLDGAEYGDASVPVSGNVNPDAFRFVIFEEDDAAAEYADVAALREAFDVTIPEDARDGEDWKGPASGVREGEYAENFPVAVKRAANAGQFPAIMQLGAGVPTVEYRAESLSIHGNGIDSVGGVILEDGNGEFVYIHSGKLPGDSNSDGYVVLPAESLRVQVNYAAREVETKAALTYGEWLAQEAEKSHVLYMILYEGWDPYSASMSLDEFYELMDLFQRGILPIREISTMALEYEPAEEGGAAGNIPRTMFLYGGLKGKEIPELEDYNDTDGNPPDYIPGLDPYGMGYKLPHADWNGVGLTQSAQGTQAVVIVPGANDGDYTIAGDVNQKLFHAIEGHYVRRVTVHNNEVTVLGAIKLSGSTGYVYYYLTNSTTNGTEVSTTALPEGEKFIIEYSAREHHMSYKVEAATGSALPNGASADPENEAYQQLLDDIFGANRPLATTDGYYSFIATAPDGYTMQIFREVEGSDKGREEITGDDSPTGILHNEGYPLGMEPVYINDPNSGFNLIPGPGAPSALVLSDTFYNANVDANRTIIAVLTKKPTPQFNAFDWASTTDGASTRGTSASTDYDYEAAYKRYVDNGDKSNSFPNIVSADGWSWNTYSASSSIKSDMLKDGGTYSHVWIFQTNNQASPDGLMLDSLEINGAALEIPFTPRWHVVTSGSISSRNAKTQPAVGIKKGQSYTETVFPNGMTVRLDYLCLFAGGNAANQRVYKLTITGARSNVTVTGGNLMQYGTGGEELVISSLTGIQTENAANRIQYYGTVDRDSNPKWRDTARADVLVNSKSNLYPQADPTYGGNFRFKLADGYDSPFFYMFTNLGNVLRESGGDTGEYQASVQVDESDIPVLDDEGIPAEITPVLPIEDIPKGGMAHNVIYGPDADGWYYFNLASQGDHKIALLTVGAREVKYVVRYLDSYPAAKNEENPNERNWGTLPSLKDDLEALLKDEFDNYIGIVQNPNKVPEFHHVFGKCHPSFFKDTENDIPGEHYDDKDGTYYDTAEDTVATVPLGSENTPVDPNGQYVFADWVLVNENFEPVKVDGKELHFLGNVITIADVNEYAIKNDGLGGSAVDVYVLRLMPTWRKLTNPFRYTVALNWVDAQGKLNTEALEGNWQDLTDWDIKTGKLTVKVVTDAKPLLDWIAQHPTYTFWDDVNNNSALYQYSEIVGEEEAQKLMEAQMALAIKEYLPELAENSQSDAYQAVFKALTNRDINNNGGPDFWRMGNYAFQVYEDNAIIIVWMYEDKGGLVFRKDVQEEPFIHNDEFYFTVSGQVRAAVGKEAQAEGDTPSDGLKPLTGTYKAYPWKDDLSNIKDSEAWLVSFENGNITKIVKNDGSGKTDICFTLKDDEGIMLYVPGGEYTITETGSKSGETYIANVTHVGDFEGNEDSGWTVPDRIHQLKGSNKKPVEDEKNQTVHADVHFAIGSHNVVYTMLFENKTSALVIHKDIDPLNDPILKREQFDFNIWLALSDGEEPQQDDDGQYYCNVTIYNPDGTVRPPEMKVPLKKASAAPDGWPKGYPAENIWTGVVSITGPGEIAVICRAPTESASSANAEIYYLVQEIVESTDSFKLLEEENSNGVIAAGEKKTATFTNTSYKPGLTIAEVAVNPEVEDAIEGVEFEFTIVLDGVEDEVYNVTYQLNGEIREEKLQFKNGKATFKLHHGESITIEGLEPGIGYTVTQGENEYYLRGNAKRKDKTPNSDEIQSIKYENALPVPLKIEKSVTGDAAGVYPDAEFTFTATFTWGDYGPNPKKVQYSKGGTNATEPEESAQLDVQHDSKTNKDYIEFTLKADEAITFTNLPYGTAFEIQEDNGYYKTKVEGLYDYAADGATARGELVEKEYRYKFINALYYGTLTVTKRVEDPNGEQHDAAEFEFTVGLKPPTKPLEGGEPKKEYAYTITGSEDEPIEGTIESGGTIKLKDGQTFTIGKLLPGTEYEITEKKYKGFTTSWDVGRKGTIESGTDSGKTTALVCINTISTGNSLTLAKKVGGNMGSRSDKFTFTVKLTTGAEPGTPVSGEYVYNKPDGTTDTLTFNDKGEATVTLTHGQSITIQNLPIGAKYEITESGADSYRTEVYVDDKKQDGDDDDDVKTVSGALDEDVSIEFQNIREAAVPTGVHLRTGWIALMMLAGLAGMAGVFCRRRRLR